MERGKDRVVDVSKMKVQDEEGGGQENASSGGFGGRQHKIASRAEVGAAAKKGKQFEGGLLSGEGGGDRAAIVPLYPSRCFCGSMKGGSWGRPKKS